jgi:hypothetical protein
MSMELLSYDYMMKQYVSHLISYRLVRNIVQYIVMAHQ